MSNSIMSEIKRDHILKLLADGVREDGRGVTDVREISIETNCIESADGSARVRIGKTEVIAGVKIIPGTPFQDTPNIGVLTTGAELIPMAHSTFESGPPGEDAIELARVVDRGIRESGMVDVEKLCIVPGEEVWMCFVDIYALDYDGNLFDAANLAAVCALQVGHHTRGAVREGREQTAPDNLHAHIRHRGQNRKYFNSRPKFRRGTDFIRPPYRHDRRQWQLQGHAERRSRFHHP